MIKYTKKKNIKKVKKCFSKKRVRKTHKRKKFSKKKFSKNIFGGAKDQTPLQPLETVSDRVIENILIKLNIELEEADTEEKKEKVKFKISAVKMAGPLYIYEIMTRSEKNREKLKNALAGTFRKLATLTGNIFSGPIGALITGSISELLVRIAGKIYNHLDNKANQLDQARSSALEVSTKEDHRVLMSLMVNAFMPDNIAFKRTLFLRLCRFWITGGVLINYSWWAKLPVEGLKESDPRSKPSTAEKEFYDRLWLLCKTFIGLSGQEWNQMMAEVKTEMGTGSYELVMNKMGKIFETEDVKSLKSILGEEFVGELLGLASAELGEDFGGLFKDISKGITEGINSLKSRLPDVDISKLTKGGRGAKEFYDSVLATKKCSEEDAQCVFGTKVKTDRGSLGTVVDPDSLSSKVKTTLSNSTIPNPIYVSFPPEAILTEFHMEQNKNDDGKYVYSYGGDSLTKKDNIKEKAIEFLQTKIGDEEGGATDDPSTGESTTPS